MKMEIKADYLQERGFLLLKSCLEEKNIPGPNLVASWIYLTVARRLTYEAREGNAPGVLKKSGLSILRAELKSCLDPEVDWVQIAEESELIRIDEHGDARVPFYTAEGLNRTVGGGYSGQASKGGAHSVYSRRKRKVELISQELALGLSPDMGGYHDHRGKPIEPAAVTDLLKIIKSLDNCFGFQRPEVITSFTEELVSRASKFAEAYGHMVFEWGRRRHSKPALDVLCLFLLDHKGDPSVPTSTEYALEVVDVLMQRAQAYARSKTDQSITSKVGGAR